MQPKAKQVSLLLSLRDCIFFLLSFFVFISMFHVSLFRPHKISLSIINITQGFSIDNTHTNRQRIDDRQTGTYTIRHAFSINDTHTHVHTPRNRSSGSAGDALWLLWLSARRCAMVKLAKQKQNSFSLKKASAARPTSRDI